MENVFSEAIRQIHKPDDTQDSQFCIGENDGEKKNDTCDHNLPIPVQIHDAAADRIFLMPENEILDPEDRLGKSDDQQKERRKEQNCYINTPGKPFEEGGMFAGSAVPFHDRSFSMRYATLT
jgi:hypothetical protein